MPPRDDSRLQNRSPSAKPDAVPQAATRPTSPPPSFLAFAGVLLRSTGKRAYCLVALQLASASLQGFGLLLLIPLLSLAGVIAAPSHPSEGLFGQLEAMARSLPFEPRLSSLLVLYAVAVSLLAAFRRHQSLYAETLQQRFAAQCGIELVDTLVRAPWIKIAQAKHAELTHTLSEDLKQIHLATIQSFQLAASGILFAINLALAALISLPLLVPSLLAIGLLLLAFRPLHRHSQALAQRYRRRREAYFENLSSLLDGLKLIKTHGREAPQVDAFRQISANSVSESLAFRKTHATTQGLFETAAAIGLAVFVYAAATWLHLPAASILLLVYLYARALPQVTRIQQCWQSVQHALPSFASYQKTLARFAATDDVGPLLAKRRNSPNPPSSSASHQAAFTLRQSISLSEISFAYPSAPERPILDRLKLVLPARQTTALMGPSGCGKSTLADILCGLLAPDSGQILLDGKPLSLELMPAWQQSIAYVPQENFLFHDSIRANLLWAAPQATEEELWTALETAHAAAFVRRLPDGLDTLVGDRGSRLSGGERQRIALARALVRNPVLLILDEATNALDQESETQIAKALAALHGQLTLLLITHDAQTATQADQIYHLENGAANRHENQRASVG